MQDEKHERKEDSNRDDDECSLTEAWTSLGMSLSNDDDYYYVKDNDNDDETIRNNFKEEFKKLFLNWLKFCRTTVEQWKQLYPNELKEINEKPDIPDHLMAIDIGKLYTEASEEFKSNGRLRFGYLPLMASCSRGQIGALLAENFCERVILFQTLYTTIKIDTLVIKKFKF